MRMRWGTGALDWGSSEIRCGRVMIMMIGWVGGQTDEYVTAWSAPNFLGKREQWRWFSKNTMDQHQQMTLHPKSSLWKLNTGLQATWAMSFSTLPPDSRTLVSKLNTNLLSSEKRTLDHWATVQFFSSLAQVRRLWWQRCLKKAFVAYPPCEGCHWLSSGQLSDQQSSPWLCSLVNQTERPFWRLRKPLQVFWVD